MFKAKKIAAFAAAAIMAVSAMAVVVGAADTGSASISCTNSNYSKTISENRGTYNSVLSIYYMYGASGGTKTDMICNYGYGEAGMTKYAIINNDGSITGKYSPAYNTTVKQTTASQTTASGTNIVYSGYCESNGVRYYPMSYTLTLT